MMSSLRDQCEKGKFTKALQQFRRRRRVDELKGGFKPHMSQPLHYAARHGNVAVVRELIEIHGCNPGKWNRMKWNTETEKLNWKWSSAI